MNLTAFLIGVFGIYLGGNWVVNGTSRLARSFRVPQLLVGLTVITLVTSAPELLIAIRASLQGASGLVFGTVTGSNIANIGLVLGVSGLFAGSLPIATGIVRRGVPIMVGVSLAVYGLIFLNQITWVIGLLMIGGFVVFSVYFQSIVRQDNRVQVLATQEMRAANPLQTSDALLVEDNEIVEKEVMEKINRPFEFVRAVTGIVLLVFCSDFLVQGALVLVTQLGTNDVLIGATFIALITSAPELVAVTAATQRGQPDVAFGNLIGAAVANILLVIGVSAVVSPLTVPAQVRIYEYPVMLAFMLYMIVVALDGKLSRLEATLYSLAYGAFIAGFFFLPIF
jgi:cation:H+ antiporter